MFPSDSPSSAAASVTPDELLARCESYLRESGHDVERPDGVDYLVLRLHPGVYLVAVNPGGTVTVAFPNYWSIDSDAERLQALEAASRASMSVPMVKTFVTEDNVCSVVDLPIQLFHDHLPRSLLMGLTALQQGVTAFRVAMASAAPSFTL